MSNILKYSVICKNPQSHIISFQLVIDEVSTAKITLKLPLWRPGRYERQNYAQNIYKVKAQDEHNQPLYINKIDTNTWEIDAKESSSIIVDYDYYAAHMDAGGIWLDEEQLYINWITCAFQVMEKADISYEVSLNIPEDYKVATSLKKSKNKLYASSFFELVDSPLIASNSLQVKNYQIDDYTFYLWFQTDIELPWGRIIKDFTAFTETQIELFGEFPTSEYHFLFQILPYRHYHGVEHRDSTVITLGPSENFDEEELYDEFLGISSHELFHTWNVARIQPKEFIPYNLHKETYFDIGYILEGITTFYGDYMLYKSGIWDTAKYIKELNILLKRHFNNYGRENLSIIDSSKDLWIDGYKPGIPNRKVSIYVKGAIIALILHLKIKHITHNNHSLDDIIKSFWEKYGKKGEGYTSSDFINSLNNLSEKNFTEFAGLLLKETLPLEEPLSDLLSEFGCRLVKKNSKENSEKYWGIKLKLKNDKCYVENVVSGSPAFSKLSVGDELVALNGKRLTSTNSNILLREDKQVVLTVFRRNFLQEVMLEISKNKTFYYTFEIVQSTHNTIFI